MSTELNPREGESSVLYSSLAASPPKIVSADGNYLNTEDGVKIFDATGGAAVACIGHSNTRVKRAIASQLDDGVAYCFPQWFTTNVYEKLASFLTKSTKGYMEKVVVVGSGRLAILSLL